MRAHQVPRPRGVWPSALLRGLALLVLFAHPIVAELPDRPNVLLIFSDDLRSVAPPAGSPAIALPNLERLAARGVSFDRAYCQFPVCNPSRTSILLGRRPDSTGIVSNLRFFRDVLPDAVTLPQVFRERGYLSANIGKIFHGGASKGWDDPRAWDLSVFPRSTPLGNKGRTDNLTDGALDWPRWRISAGSDLDLSDGQAAQAAVALFEESTARPFFIAIGFNKPHPPFVAPRAHFNRYRLRRFRGEPLPTVGGLAEVAMDSASLAIFGDFANKDRRRLQRSYYAAASYMDSQLGVLLDSLDRLELWVHWLHLLGSLAGVVFGRYRAARVAVFVSLLMFNALRFSFGAINHGEHLGILLSFVLIFLPAGWSARRTVSRAVRAATLVTFSACQGMILLIYSMSGLWKVIGVARQVVAGEVHYLMPSGLAQQVAAKLLETETVAPLGPWLIDNYWIGPPLSLASIYLETFALWVVLRPALHRPWAIGLILFHLSTQLTMGIAFIQHPLWLALFLALSPFRPEANGWRRMLGDLPLLGRLTRSG